MMTRRGLRPAVRPAAAAGVALAALLTAAGSTAAPLPAGGAATAERPLVIGLFVPRGGPDEAAGREAERGAALAVQRANSEGGIAGRALSLKVAPSDRLWEGGSGALTGLLYEENAVAVIGALDGRAAHLAEQIITRARGRAVFVSPWASEVTITRNRIPWFFSVAPDDDLQGAALAAEIFAARGIGRAAAWVEEGFDTSAAAAALEKRAPAGGLERLPAAAPESRDRLARGIRSGDYGALVLFARPAAAADLVLWLHRERLEAPLFGPLALAVPAFLDRAGEAAAGMWIPGAACDGGPEARRLRAAFEAEHGVRPTPVALYSHDAVAAVVQALRAVAAGGGKPSLAETLAGIAFGGATGEVRFDEHRSRRSLPARAILTGAAPVGQGHTPAAGGGGS